MGTNNRCVVLYSVVLLILLSLSPAFASASGLQNPGFETGSLSPGWVDPPGGDSVSVVGTEGSDIQTYADQGITVDPYLGHKMVRLGTPKEESQKQPRGDNVVSQPFIPNGSTLKFSARVFSWEHRGDDHVVISLTSRTADISAVAISGQMKIGKKTYTCDDENQSGQICDFKIDGGKSGDFVNTGWVEFTISGLPYDPANPDNPDNKVTLTYDVIGGQNESHATWAYFDNTNTPPVAKFSVTPNNNPPAGTSYTYYEGQPFIVNDESYDPDAPDDKIVNWDLEITDPAGEVQTFTKTKDDSSTFSYLPADNGPYSISLTVTDSHGATSSTVTTTFTVENVAPLARSLNYEVLAGTQTQLVSRFADAGFKDTHSLSDGSGWTTSDNSLISDNNVEEVDAPLLATGILTATFSAPENTDHTYTATATIKDKDGGSTDVDVNIKVLTSPCNGREQNNDVSHAISLATGGAYLSCVDQPGDVDVFKITLADGTPIPPGSEVLIRLKDLPADFDLIALERIDIDSNLSVNNNWSGSGAYASWLKSGGYASWLKSGGYASWLKSGGYASWLKSGGYASWLKSGGYASWLKSGGYASWLKSGGYASWLKSSNIINQLPLSELAYTPPDNSDLGGTDINLAQLGFDFSPESGLIVAGYSANRGLGDEGLLLRTNYNVKNLYVAVVGNNGAFSSTPYSLQIETSLPLDVKDSLGGDVCVGNALVTDPDPNNTDQPMTLLANNNPTTLFVTQKDRLEAMYPNEVASLLNVDSADPSKDGELVKLAKQQNVNGMIVSLPSNDYAGWDQASDQVKESGPCSVIAANNVTNKIRDDIFNILKDHSSIQYVVLVGNDTAIPYRRVPDSTSTTNERLYTNDSFTDVGSPLYVSMVTGNVLTDDFYVDDAPIIGQGGLIYVPKLSVARMVETPAEIAGVAQAFIDSGGVIEKQNSPLKAFVTGYDFFGDIADYTANTFDKAGLDYFLMDDSGLPDSPKEYHGQWDANALRCGMLGSPSSLGCASHDINNFNAHFTHFVGLSAKGFDNQEADFLSSSEVADAGGTTPVMKSELAYTLGCHAGLNVPDGTALSNLFGSGIDANLDFPQSMAKQRAVYVANTGFGLGIANGIAGTERLMALFSEEILSQDTIGKALTVAKQRFLNETGVVGPYEEKSSIEATLYGLPMYKLSSSGHVGTNNGDGLCGSEGCLDLNVTNTIMGASSGIPDSHNDNTPPPIDEVTTDQGSYFTVDGGYQAIMSRPIQPVYKRDIDIDPSTQVHGIVITGGQYTDYTGDPGFDPVITQMVQDWGSDIPESSTCLNAFWPEELVKSSVVNNGNQQLIVVPGQFRCDPAISTDTVMGTERLFTSLSVNVLRSDSSDTQPPQVSGVDISRSANGDATITVHATDGPSGSGIAKVVILIYPNSCANLDTCTVTSVSSEGLSVPIVGLGDQKILVQVIDGAGNVTTLSGKGANMQGIQVDAGPDIFFYPSSPVTLTASVLGLGDPLPPGRDFTYTWDFGDGGNTSGKLNGNPTFSVQHQYTSTSTATVKVTGNDGGIGVDQVTLSACGDPNDSANPGDFLYGYGYLDYTGCDADNSSSTHVSLFVTTAGPISATSQYRINLDIQSSPHNPVPDGKADIMLKYQGGSATGLQSLVVTPTNFDANGQPHTLEFDFDLADVGWTGTYFDWYAETQDGVSGKKSAGFNDVMPDTEMLRYTMH
jgi:hypothetical protein